MADTYYTDIEKLYVTYFGRPADPTGLHYWETVVEGSKGSTAAVSAAFTQSAEYQTAFAGLDAYHVVDALYSNLFGRHAELDGLTYWGQALANGTVRVDQAAAAIAGGAQGADLHVLDNKAALATAFTQEWGTVMDLLGGHREILPILLRIELAGVTDDASLAKAMAPLALDAAVTNLLAVPGPSDIELLYVSYLGRPADPASVRYWETVIETHGGRTDAVVDAITQTDEFKASFKGLDATQTVTAIYNHLLDRAPTGVELAKWTPGLADGSHTAADTIGSLLSATRYGHDMDFVVLSRQVDAALDFTSALDTPAKVQAYQGSAADAIGAAYLKTVADAVSASGPVPAPDALARAIDSLLALHAGAGAGGIGLVGINAFHPDVPA